MATIKIRKVENELPHARLYLDDLQEIEDIVRRACARLHEPLEVSFFYEPDDDTRATDIEDLQQHAGFVPNFRMSITGKAGADYVVGINECLLHFSSFLPPTLSVPWALKDEEWFIAGQIQRVFYDRRDRLKAKTYRIESMPLATLAAALGTYATITIMAILVKAISHKHLIRIRLGFLLRSRPCSFPYCCIMANFARMVCISITHARKN